MKTQSAKAKGRRLQQWLRDKLLDYFKLGENDIISRSMGAGGTDLIISPHAKEYFNYAVESKNHERMNFWEAWSQTLSNTKEGEQPLLLISRNRERPVVVIDAEHFISLLPKPKRTVRGF